MSKIAGKLNAEMMQKVIHDRRAKLFAVIVAKTGSKQSVIDRAMQEIESLREQVEKLTKELDKALERERNCAIATHRQAYCIQQCASIIGPDTSATIDGLPKAVKRVTEKLAALAEQNEKMKDALKTVVDDAEECTDHDDWTAMLLSLDAYHDASTCIEEINELPDLASPVLNRIRAEENEAIIAAANALENIASTSSSTRIRRVANEALTAIRARRK